MFSESAQSNNINNFAILPMDCLIPYKDNPFKIRKDEKYIELVESIQENGVLFPIIVRKIEAENGKYEILAGHNRVEASKEANLIDIPARIYRADDNLAKIIVAETNLTQREFILPSERGFAYKMELEAIKNQGKRSDLLTEFEQLTLSHGETKLNTGDKIALKYKNNRSKIYRYIRLTYLIEGLQDIVNRVDGRVSIFSGAELSYLETQQQEYVLSVLKDNEKIKISSIKASELKKLGIEKKLTKNHIEELLRTEKVGDSKNFGIKVIQKAVDNAKAILKKDNELQMFEVKDTKELTNIIVEAVKGYIEKK